jgi:cytochrome c biogenesis protein CcmG, thiol:disulfide interchange protein DsbE
VAVDRSGRVAIDWGVYGAPETFLVNPQGVVVYKHVGALTPETWTREILPRVTPPPATRS